nr:hypothetical protein BaRGS_032943 [Batillaria attramentaria]
MDPDKSLHHDLIPWDDDIDVIIPARQRPLVKEVLRSVPGFALWAPTGVQWKFYWRGSPALQHKPFRWPYVDIFFYTTNGTHLRDDHPDYQAHFREKRLVVSGGDTRKRE